MKSLAFIDNFVESPTNHNVNDYVNYKNIVSTYHMPAKYGMSSLKDLKRYDAFVLLGSASHVHENLEWHHRLIEYIIPKLEAGIPVFGICFGHQLIAHHYGSKLDYYQSDQILLKEAREVQITQTTLGFNKEEKLMLGFSHSQVITELSDAFLNCAVSSRSQYEFIQHSKYPFWGVQAHPEASAKFLENDAHVSDQSTKEMVLLDGRRVLDAFYAQIP